jgi:hypothetical protein
MSVFSKKIRDFLKQVGADPYLNVAIVPKNKSCGRPGDILFFKYPTIPPDYILGSGYRIFLIIEPVVKLPGTGNLLLTGFRFPYDWSFSDKDFTEVYKNKELPEENYRTYIIQKIQGPLRKVNSKTYDVEKFKEKRPKRKK